MTAIGMALVRIAEVGALTVLTIWSYSHGHDTLGMWAAIVLICDIAFTDTRMQSK